MPSSFPFSLAPMICSAFAMLCAALNSRLRALLPNAPLVPILLLAIQFPIMHLPSQKSTLRQRRGFKALCSLFHPLFRGKPCFAPFALATAPNKVSSSTRVVNLRVPPITCNALDGHPFTPLRTHRTILHRACSHS